MKKIAGMVMTLVVMLAGTSLAAEVKNRINPDKVNLLYNDNADTGAWYLILPNGDANCEKGWQYTDATKQNIHICSTTCDLVQSNSNARITLMFGCVAGNIGVY